MGSYSDALRSKHKEEREKEEKAKDAELGVLKEAVASGRLTQEGIEAAFGRMEELTSTGGKGGKGKKGGFSFKSLIGQFGDVGKQQNKTLSGGGAAPQQVPQQAPQSNPQQGAQTPGSPTPGGGSQALPALPQRKSMFKTQKDMDDEAIGLKKREFDEVTKPTLDYDHKLRMEEIDKQYGTRLNWRSGVKGSGIALSLDSNGKPIDPNGDYQVAYDNTGRPKEALPTFQKPSSQRASGPEAKVESLKKDFMAEAEANGHPIDEKEADQRARRLVLAQARATLSSTLESTKGKQFANRVRAELEKGIMSPATARSVIGYAGTEAKRRFNEDMATIASGKSISEIEDDIYAELGTSRQEVSGYLRQGAKKFRFDPDLKPIPERPAANP